MKIIQITPNLPPTISGVGDYALRVGEAIINCDKNIAQVHMVACGSLQQDKISHQDATNLTGMLSANALVKAITHESPDLLLINYVGYGYAPRGAPLWILEAFKVISQRNPQIKIFTIFHELFAVGNPVQSAFWLSPIQRYIAMKLALLSNYVASTSNMGVSWLNRIRSKNRPIAKLLPVCSTVGEPLPNHIPNKRLSYAVVFAGGGWRHRVLLDNMPSLLRSLRSAGYKKLVQVGKGGAPLTSEQGIECIHLGEMNGEEIGNVLLGASLGIVVYPLHLITKSSVCASYLAHHVPALVIDEELHEGPLKSGYEIVVWHDNDSLPSPNDRQLWEIANRGYQWYQIKAHSRIHAEWVLTEPHAQ